MSSSSRYERDPGYEDADMGDENRKNKFLRLMGSKKKEDSTEQSKNKCIGREEPSCHVEQTSSAQKSSEPQEESLEVKSANEWESAELGDVGRRNKFLRLMGAAKKEHSGKFVIGEKEKDQSRKEPSSEDLNERLERQYNQGLQLRLSGAARRHTGFGFEEPPKEESKPEEGATTAHGEISQTKEETVSNDNPQTWRDREYRERRDATRFGDKEFDSHRGDPNESHERRDEYSNQYHRRGSDTYNHGDRRDYSKERDSRPYRDYNRDRSHDRRDRNDRSGYDRNRQQQYDNRSGRSGQNMGTNYPQQHSQASSQQSAEGYSSHRTPVIGDYGTPVGHASPYGHSANNPSGQYPQQYPNQHSATAQSGSYGAYGYGNTAQHSHGQPPVGGQWQSNVNQPLYTSAPPPPGPPPPETGNPGYPGAHQQYSGAPDSTQSQAPHFKSKISFVKSSGS